MAKKKTSKRATKSKTKPTAQPVKLWQLLLLIGLIVLGYFYQEGYFDKWLAPYGWASQPTPVAIGGADGPQVTLDKAVMYEGDWYQAYFTRPTYPEVKSERSGGIDAAMVADIAGATQSVKIAVFDYDLHSLTEALIEARQRGVQVQMVVDDENLAAPEVAEVMGQLEAAGVQVTYDTRSAFMHNKIMLIDDRIVWTGSMNFTSNGVYRNDNNMIRTTVGPLVQNYISRFDDLFAGRMGGQAPANTPNVSVDLANGVNVQTFFSPSDRGLPFLIEALASSSSSVKVLAFSFTDDETAQTMIDLHQKGVDVRVVMEKRSLEGTGSEYATLRNAGIEVVPDGNCYVAHNKVIIIDDRIVITGSYNFTSSAERNNDENFLIINDPRLGQQFSQEWERMWLEALNPQRCGS